MAKQLTDDELTKHFGVGIVDGQEEDTTSTEEVSTTDTEVVAEEEKETTTTPQATPGGEQQSAVTDEPQNAGEAQTAINDGDVQPNDLSDIVGEDGKYLTYKELAKGYSNLQSTMQKKLNSVEKENKERQKALEQWNEYYQQQQMIAQQQQEVASVTQEQLDYNIDVAPMDTFRWAAENNPQLIPTIISTVREKKGNQVADAMNIEYQNLMALQQQQMFMYQQQAFHEASKPAVNVEDNIQAAMGNISSKYGEEFNKLSDRVSERIEQGSIQIDWGNPASIESAIDRTYLQVFREDAVASMQKSSQQPRDVSPQAEAGSPGQAPPADTFDDSVRQGVLDQYNKMRRRG